MPIFLVMSIGYILKRKGIIDGGFIKTANTIIFNVVLPIKLFNDVSKTSINEYFDLRFIVFIISGTILSVIATWLIGLVVIKKKS